MCSNDELLQFAVENRLINTAYLQAQIEMTKEEDLIQKHPYKIWRGEDGKWKTYLPSEHKRVLRQRNSEAEIRKVVIEYWKQQNENPILREVFNEWNDRRLNLKKISKSTHERNTQIFNRHYIGIENKRIKSVSEDFIIDFLEEQIPEHALTAKAFSGLKTITRGMLKRAKKRKLISFNVEEVLNELDVTDIDFQKTIKEDWQEVFDENETPQMIEYLIHNLDTKNLGILLMFLTGIRVGELVALKHTDFENNILKIRRTETRYRSHETNTYVYGIKEFPKSEAGVRTVIIPDDFIWMLDKIKETNAVGEYIFVEKNKRLTTNTIRRRLDRLCEKLHIYRKSPHKIRKTYASILLDNNIDHRLITDLMGHVELECTENYYHRNRRSLERKSQILSSIPDFKLAK